VRSPGLFPTWGMVNSPGELENGSSGAFYMSLRGRPASNVGTGTSRMGLIAWADVLQLGGVFL
jgi:hypothetical protein